MLSYYCFNLNSTHIKIITRVLKYIKEILHYNIYYEENKNLINYTNINFVKAIDNCCSINK